MTATMTGPHRAEILVIHPGALGDVLQAVPALRALRALGGGSRVTFAGQPRLGRFLAGVAVVDVALSFDGLGLESLFAGDAVPERLQSELARLHRVVSWFGARAEPYPERLRGLVPGTLVAAPVPDTDPPPTVWEHLLETVAPWGVEPAARRAPLDLPAEWRDQARAALSALGADRGRPLLAVHPGAGGAWKRWPVGKVARVVESVARETGCQVLLHQGPADEDAAGELLSALARRAPGLTPIRLREPDLGLLAAILRIATVYLGADSGVSHLAAAVGAPAVIVFTAAARDRWAPWSPTAVPLVMTEDGSDVGAATDALMGGLG